MIVIRKAVPDDVPGIAEVHVASWRTSYKGIVSDTYLANLSVDSRAGIWMRALNPNDPHVAPLVFVAADEANRIIGFASGGRARSHPDRYDGELYAIYLLEDCQRQGLGRRLVREIVHALRERGFQSMIVWVLEQNPAIEFYRKLGGIPIDRKELRIGEQALIETALGWESLDLIDLGRSR